MGIPIDLTHDLHGTDVVSFLSKSENSPLTCLYSWALLVDMKSYQVTRYACDHCSKTSLAAWAMRKHEEWCFFNPDRKCPECQSVGIAGVTEPEHPNPIKAAHGECPVCLRALCARYNKAAWRGSDEGIPESMTYTKDQYEADLEAYRELKPRVNPWSQA